MYLQNENPKTPEICSSKIHKQSQDEFYRGNPYLYKSDSQLESEAQYKKELDRRAKCANLGDLVNNFEPSKSDIAPEISRCERKEAYDYLVELSGNEALINARNNANFEDVDLSDSERLEIWNAENAGNDENA